MTPLLIAAVVIASGPSREAAKKALTPASTGVAAELSEAEVAEQAAAFLGAIDTPISLEQWRSLGPRAQATLAAVADDGEALPTRRARAIDGLTIVGGTGSRTRFAHLAESEAEPFVVRLAAVRGLGAIVPPGELPAVLLRLLSSARDSRVRAATAEVLSTNAQGTCPVIDAQLKREGQDGRAQFHRAATACGLGR